MVLGSLNHLNFVFKFFFKKIAYLIAHFLIFVLFLKTHSTQLFCQKFLRQPFLYGLILCYTISFLDGVPPMPTYPEFVPLSMIQNTPKTISPLFKIEICSTFAIQSVFFMYPEDDIPRVLPLSMIQNTPRTISPPECEIHAFLKWCQAMSSIEDGPSL